MAKVEWDDSFSVNHAEIDEQHKKWIEILNTMKDTLAKADMKTWKTAGAVALKEMLEYADKHFKFEEKYMQENDFPEAHLHARMHKDFDTKIYKYNRDIQDGIMVLNTEILKLIENWLIGHIKTEDQKYARFIEGKNPAS